MDYAQINLETYDAGWSSWLHMKQYGPASRWLRALILDACRSIPDDLSSVHDFGCGEGSNTWLLASRFTQATIVGSDFSASAVAVSKRFERPPRLVFHHDAADTAADTPADLVTCFEVLEHVVDWHSVLGRLAEAANRFLLLSTPTGRMRPFETNIGHVRNFRRGEIEEFLATVGWRPVSVAYAGFPFYSPLYRDLCQLTNAGDANFTRGRYGLPRRLVAGAIYAAFRYLSTRRLHGDQFVGLFGREVARH